MQNQSSVLFGGSVADRDIVDEKEGLLFAQKMDTPAWLHLKQRQRCAVRAMRIQGFSDGDA